METAPQAKIVEITRTEAYESYLYKCLAPMPFRKYRNRQQYLENAIPKGFHKKILIYNEKVVGQIEYAPSLISGYPIIGKRVVVVNCIWVLRKAKGHDFGKLLINNMKESEKNAFGFATIGLENHWSGWFKKDQLEELGFKSVDSIKVAHKFKRPEQVFSIYLMWMQAKQNARPPSWKRQRLLMGETFCIAHPLYRSETTKGYILEEKR